MKTHVASATVAGLTLVLAACSSGNGGGSDVHATAYPAFTPTMPQLQTGSLQAIATPVLVPVHFPGETLQRSLDGALMSWVSSGAFGALSEYGVTSGSVASSIGQQEQVQSLVALPSSSAPLTGDAIEAWLERQLDGTHPEFGPVDASTLASKIFVLFYPSGTNITLGDRSSCTSFQSYDAGVTLPSRAVAHYVVVPRCAPPAGVGQTDWTILGATRSILDRVGNPTPSRSSTLSGTAGFDDAHAAFGANGPGLGDACAPDSLDAAASPRMLSLRARAWSNTSVAAFHDPCLPAPAGAYFVVGRGVSLRAGQSKTIDVQLLSDGPTSGPWTVSAHLMGATGFTFAWDKDAGSDGDTLHLTITAPSSAASDVAVINSGLGDRQSFWLLALESAAADCSDGLLCDGVCVTGATDCSACAGASLLCAARHECVSDCAAGCGGAAPLECFVCDAQQQHPVGTCSPDDVATNACLNGDFNHAYRDGAPGRRCGCSGSDPSTCPGENEICDSEGACFECGDVGLTAFPDASNVCKNGRVCDAATNTCH